MSDDQYFRDVLNGRDEPPRPQFRAALRHRLHDEWHDRLVPADAPATRPSWWFGVAAAAVAAIVVAGLAWLWQPDSTIRTTPPADTMAAPAGTRPGSTAPASPTAPVTAPLVSALDPQGGVDGPVMYWRERTDESSEDALGSGTLALDGDCLLLDDGAVRYPVLWEFGTRWDAAAQAVVAPDGTVFPTGTWMQAGGGFHSTTSGGGIDAWTTSTAVLARVDQCATVNEFGEVFVVQDPPRLAGAPASGCLAGQPAATAIPSLLALLAERRASGGDRTCVVDAEQLTGMAPACWGACTDGTALNDGIAPTVAIEYAHWGEVTDPSGSTWWVATIPVSYPGGRDVVESWQIREGDDGWELTLSSIDPPLPERGASADVINTFLGDLAGQDWAAAAGLLLRGGAGIEERTDVLELQPATLDPEGVAAALAAWCADGCDTTPIATPHDLTFTGGYEVTRNGATLRATWFEGEYGIGGTPFRGPDSPPVGAAALAAWPPPPPPGPDDLDRLPYLLPSESFRGTSASRSSGSIGDLPYGTRYTQVWFDRARSAMLTVTSVLDHPEFPPGANSLGLAGWEAASVTSNAPPAVGVELGTTTSTVSVHGVGIDVDEAVAIARGLTARPAGAAGWNLSDAAQWEPFGEAWESERSVHTVVWFDDGAATSIGELSIGFGAADLATANQAFADARRFIEVDGHPAVLTVSDGIVGVTWQPASGVTALFGWRGTVDAALTVLDSFEPVDRAMWEAAAEPFGPNSDGCSGLFC